MDKVIEILLVPLFISHFNGNPAVFNPYHGYSGDKHAERISFLFKNLRWRPAPLHAHRLTHGPLDLGPTCLSKGPL